MIQPADIPVQRKDLFARLIPVVMQDLMVKVNHVILVGGFHDPADLGGSLQRFNDRVTSVEFTAGIAGIGSHVEVILPATGQDDRGQPTFCGSLIQLCQHGFAVFWAVKVKGACQVGRRGSLLEGGRHWGDLVRPVKFGGFEEAHANHGGDPGDIFEPIEDLDLGSEEGQGILEFVRTHHLDGRRVRIVTRERGVGQAEYPSG